VIARQLIALLNGRPVGVVEGGRNARLRFVYAEDWRASAQAFPLSLSMPLAAAEHKHDPIEAFLWGLLPDNQVVLERWAKRFQVSARNAFGLISNVGEDCAGAVGGEYRVQAVGARQLRKLAAELHLSPDQIVARAAELAAAVPQASAEIAEQLTHHGLRHPLVARLPDALVARAKRCLAELR
jgi:HipA-like protein